MELLKIKSMSFFLTGVLVMTGCSKDAGYFSLTESVDARVEQSLEWNGEHQNRNLVVNNDDYTIYCMSDSHLGTAHNLDRFLGNAIQSNPSAVVLAGDLCSGKEEDYLVLKKHLPFNDSIPYFTMAGNHDLHFAGWDTFFSLFGSSTYSFEVKTPAASDLFICLDTSEGTLGRLQYNWLKKILELTRKDYRRCIIITHNNLFRPKQAESTNPLPDEILALTELFTVNHVDMIIAGHDHRRDDRIFGITRYIVMDPIEDSAENAGYLVLRVVNGSMVTNFVNLQE
jgi:predicted phosphodiesterase